MRRLAPVGKGAHLQQVDGPQTALYLVAVALLALLVDMRAPDHTTATGRQQQRQPRAAKRGKRVGTAGAGALGN